MTPEEVHAIMTAVYTYRVEIRHAAADTWNHIHPPDWETHPAYDTTMAYAVTVRADHPGSQVRVVESLDGHPDHYVPLT